MVFGVGIFFGERARVRGGVFARRDGVDCVFSQSTLRRCLSCPLRLLFSFFVLFFSYLKVVLVIDAHKRLAEL